MKLLVTGTDIEVAKFYFVLGVVIGSVLTGFVTIIAGVLL